jgi:vacuolar-type H+-ATPase subunit D/Vma8
MKNLVEISKTQMVMAFVATCIETTARWLGTSYKEVYQRMKRVNLIEQYILPHYETLHTESREKLAEGLVECMNNWEAKK